MRLSKRLLSAALSTILLLSAMVSASAAVLRPEDVTPGAVALSGDVNGDGKVDTTDARLVLQHAVGKIQLDEVEQEMTDVNGDGWVDTTDARLILQYAVGKIEAFPAPLEGEVDFRVLQYTSTLDYIDPPFQLFIARSSEEFVDLLEQAKILPKDWELEDEFFEGQAAVFILCGYSIIGPKTAIDRLSVNNRQLSVDTTTGLPLIVSMAPSTNVFLLSVKKADIPAMDDYLWTDTRREFFEYDPDTEIIIQQDEEFFEWHYNWLNEKRDPNIEP